MIMKKCFPLILLLTSCALYSFSVTKYVIPCGGYGTRMLPFTYAVPKEMVPLMNVPALQETVEEGLRGGLHQFYIITKRKKSCIEDHFDASPEIDFVLNRSNKKHLTRSIKEVCDNSQFVYIRQSEPYGTGHAVMQAKDVIADDYFAVGWPDVFVLGEPDIFKNMIELCERENASIIAVQEIPMNEVNHYGVVVTGKQLAPNVFEVTDLVEKPKPEESPSNLVNVGRFILSKKIFTALEETPYATNGELQLPDAMLNMMKNGERILAYKTKGELYDIGRPIPWLEGTIRYGLAQEKFAEDVRALLKRLTKELEL